MEKQLITLQEAKDKGIEWTDWRDPAVQPGQWVISDDDYVVRVKRVYDLRNSRGYPSRLLYTVAGSISQGAAHFKCHSIASGRNNLCNGNNRGEARRLSIIDKRILDLILSGMQPIEAVNIISNISDLNLSRAKAKNLLKRKSAIEYMGNQIKEKLEKAGLSEAWWFERVAQMIEDPEVKSEVRWDMLKTAGMMHQLIDTPKKHEVSQTNKIYLDQDSIDMLEQENKVTVTE